MNSMGNFQKKFVISVIFVKKPKNIVVFALNMCGGIFYNVSFGDFYMELHTVDSDEAMKRGDEAFNGSSLQFLRSVKRFIASIF